MRHWVDELSDKEENRDAKAKARLGILGYERVRNCVNDALEIYNARHPLQKNPIAVATGLESELQKWIKIGKHGVGFEFVAGPTFNWVHLTEEQTTIREPGTVYLDNNSTMWLEFDGRCYTIDNIVQETLEPLCFPGTTRKIG